MEALISAAGKINRDLDNREFIQENGPLFAQVRPFQLELAANDKVAKIEVDDISKVVLSNELSKLTQQLTTVRCRASTLSNAVACRSARASRKRTRTLRQ